MKIADIRKQTTDKMAKSVDTLKHDLAKVRTGRAHPGLIDHLRVDYYGSPVPINQVGNVTLADARRRELTKIVKHEGENAKVAVRNVRRDAIAHLKDLLKNSEVSEDEEK